MARSEARSSGRRRLVLAATLALAAPVTIACNSLIGLSDFEKGQCAGARCPDEGGLFDQLVNEGGTDAPRDTGPDALGADPVSWAQWPMPNYNDGGAGEPPSAPPLAAGGDGGLVIDTITNITWRSTLVPGTFKATAADPECRKIAVGGPWRAPKRIELVTLLDYSRSAPFVDTSRFLDLSLDTVWSTSEVRPFAPDNPSYWVVNFGTGKVLPLTANTPARVLCVLAK
jgi:hypothetical protein